MDEAWLHVLERLGIQEVIRLRRISPHFSRLCCRFLRMQTSFDLQRDCPRAVANPDAISSIMSFFGNSLRHVTLRVHAPDAKYEAMASSSHIDTSVIRTICQKSQRLVSIEMDRMILTLGAIEKFGELPATIERFRISNCLMSCSQWDVITIIRRSFDKLLERCHCLRTFEISGRSLNNCRFNLDPQILNRLSDTIENLAISVGSSIRIEDLAFLKRKKLRSLVLQRSFISASSLQDLVPMADTLVHLDLSYSPNLLDATLVAKLHMLKRLSLSSNRDGIDDEALSRICSSCPLLESLSIDQCSLLTRESLMQLGKLQHLKRLTMSGVSNADDAICYQIAKCSKLEELDLNFCRKIRKAGLCAILTNLRHLDHLEVLGIADYSHQLLAKRPNFPKTIVCDGPIQHFTFTLPPIPNMAVA
ncbi:unnamed protein product [Caenorhabditis bovis]|uniref:F-box domain-containing protein n=1 Tax=Caenorhabditis bovis TaxID=2654633 RepID=A0A8S1F5G1_9PELO|nr:unnamed protein product [Caenorhabditis bovis]